MDDEEDVKIISVCVVPSDLCFGVRGQVAEVILLCCVWSRGERSREV